MKTTVILLSSFLLGGCVSQSAAPGSAEASLSGPIDSEPPVVCKKEKPTGSNRPVVVCRQVAGAIDREQTERDVRVLQRQTEIR